MMLPHLETAAHWAELIGGILTSLAAIGSSWVVRRIYVWWRALAAAPKMLHGHGEKEGVLHAEEIEYPFRDKNGTAKAAD